MAWRAISDTVGHSESLSALSDLGERLYWRLLGHSDSHGRVAGSPAKTRAVCFPLVDVEHEEVGLALQELERVGRIWVYVEDGTAVIQIVDFDKNQPGELLRKRGLSRLPESTTLKSGQLSDYSGTLYELPANEPDSRTTPTLGRPRPGKSREERKEGNPTAVGSTTHGRALNEVPAPANGAAAEEDAEKLEELLDDLGIDGTLKGRARADGARALSVARYTLANGGGGAYFRKVFDSGDWPRNTDRPGKPTKTPYEMAEAVIKNLGTEVYLRAALDSELDARGVTDPLEREALHALADSQRDPSPAVARKAAA